MRTAAWQALHWALFLQYTRISCEPSTTLGNLANMSSCNPGHSARKYVVLLYPFHRWGNCGSEVTQLIVSDEVMTGLQVFPPLLAAGLSRVLFQAWVRVEGRDREKQDGPNIMTMTIKPTKPNKTIERLRQTLYTSSYFIFLQQY